MVLWWQGGRVNLEDVMIMVSSEAILTGYRPNFRLLAVALNSAGQPLSSIPFSLSDAFVVRNSSTCSPPNAPPAPG